jgi:hypothetical protein
MDDLTRTIDMLLDQHRPARYDSADKSWMAPIEAEIASMIPEQSARAVAARDKVRRREEMATRSVNRLLRDIGRTGQPPLDWMDLAPRPIAWDEHRVRLDECLPADFREWAAVERRRAANDFSARNDACEGAEWIADKLDANGARRIGELFD